LFTSKLYSRLYWRMGSYNTFFSGFIVALLRAKRSFCSVLLVRLFNKLSAAICTIINPIDFKFLTSKCVRAFAATSCLSAPLQPLGVGFVFFIAYRTSSFNHTNIIP
jgi:hypothetical protein